MPRRRKLTDEAIALLRAEAHRRAEIHSNKQLAKVTGLAPGYIAQIVARLRREFEAQRQMVSRETIVNSQSIDDAEQAQSE